MRRGTILALLVLASATARPLEAGQTSAPAVPGQAVLLQEDAEHQAEVDRLRAEARAAYTPQELFVPHFAVGEGWETDLYVVNLITDPVALEVEVLGHGGKVASLGRQVVPPNRHLRVSLGEALRAGGSRLKEGSVELRFDGTGETISAWAVLRRGRQAVELKFEGYAKVTGSRYLSFWDDSVQGTPTFHLANVSHRPIEYSYVVGRGVREGRRVRGKLRPYERNTIRLAPHGRKGPEWLRVEHGGQPGDLMAVGLLEGRDVLARLPWLSHQELAVMEHHALRIPPRAGPGPRSSPADGAVVVFNPGEVAQTAVVEVIGLFGGESLAALPMPLEAFAVGSLPIERLVAHVPEDRRGEEMRLRVSGERPLATYGFRRVGSGETVDLAFFAAASGHGNGTYPLPDLSRHEVFTTLLNLGSEDVEVFGHVYWEGGEHAVGPLTVPAGGAIRIDYAHLAAAGTPDLLGRTMDAAAPGGFFKWMARAPDAALLGRTEARPHEAADLFGFSCFGCCWNMPRAQILPGEVHFLPGETRSFETTVVYSTCSGSMGPYPVGPASMSTPFPFSWNGSTVGATDAAVGDFSFEVFENEIRATCREFLRRLFGFGKAVTCERHLLKPGGRWSLTAHCTQQSGPTNHCQNCTTCCRAKYDYGVCLSKGLGGPHLLTQLNACLTTCATDQCG